MLFKLWVLYWNVSGIFFLMFRIQNSSNSWYRIYFFPVICIYKRLNFLYYFLILYYFSWFNTTVTASWKRLLSLLLMGIILDYSFFHSFRRIQSRELIWTCFTLWNLQNNNWTQWKITWLPLIDLPNPLWYLLRIG